MQHEGLSARRRAGVASSSGPSGRPVPASRPRPMQATAGRSAHHLTNRGQPSARTHRSGCGSAGWRPRGAARPPSGRAAPPAWAPSTAPGWQAGRQGAGAGALAGWSACECGAGVGWCMQQSQQPLQPRPSLPQPPRRPPPRQRAAAAVVPHLHRWRNTGSVRKASPSSWTSSVLCPTHVACTASPAAAVASPAVHASGRQDGQLTRRLLMLSRQSAQPCCRLARCSAAPRRAALPRPAPPSCPCAQLRTAPAAHPGGWPARRGPPGRRGRPLQSPLPSARGCPPGIRR